ncbi:MAG: transglutaminase-like domain-containing protein [Nitrospinota bacterium]|nr:transglutaminase-like domain-containing protein [Nitrospinota bacterium]
MRGSSRSKTLFLAMALAVTLTAPFGAANPSPGYEKTLEESWENTLFQGKKVGFSYMQVESGEKGYHVTGRAVLKLTLMDVTQDMSFSSEAYLTPNGRLEKFSYLQTMGNQRQNIRGVVKDGVIRMVVTGAGGGRETRVEGPVNVNLAHIVEHFFNQDLAVGKQLTAPVFIEALRAVDNLHLEVTGKRKVKTMRGIEETYEVVSRMHGVSTTTYVTNDGRRVSGSSLMGISFRETTEEDALKIPAVNVPITSLITFSLIVPDKSIEDPDSLKRLSFSIGGLSSPEIMEDERQKTGDFTRVLDKMGKRTFIVPMTVRKVSPSVSISIPQAGKAHPEELKPTPEIQSDNKMIQKVAVQITGKETDSWKAAKKINQWVFLNLEKTLVDSFTAIDVLLSKKGECQSHTNLAVALLQAKGIPARVAGGLVYSKTNGGFLYHAWPEVYVGQWVAMDPTLGQDVADPTHIKLIEGGVESMLGLMRYITKISISIDKAE